MGANSRTRIARRRFMVWISSLNRGGYPASEPIPASRRLCVFWIGQNTREGKIDIYIPLLTGQAGLHLTSSGRLPALRQSLNAQHFLHRSVQEQPMTAEVCLYQVLKPGPRGCQGFKLECVCLSNNGRNGRPVRLFPGPTQLRDGTERGGLQNSHHYSDRGWPRVSLDVVSNKKLPIWTARGQEHRMSTQSGYIP